MVLYNTKTSLLPFPFAQQSAYFLYRLTTVQFCANLNQRWNVWYVTAVSMLVEEFNEDALSISCLSFIFQGSSRNTQTSKILKCILKKFFSFFGLQNRHFFLTIFDKATKAN